MLPRTMKGVPRANQTYPTFIKIKYKWEIWVFFFTSDVMVPILIKIPKANKPPPTIKSKAANPMAFQGTIEVINISRAI